jgi:hypothetical protein
MKIWPKIVFYVSKYNTHPEEIRNMAAITKLYSEIRVLIFGPQTSEMAKFYCSF